MATPVEVYSEYLWFTTRPWMWRDYVIHKPPPDISFTLQSWISSTAVYLFFRCKRDQDVVVSRSHSPHLPFGNNLQSGVTMGPIFSQCDAHRRDVYNSWITLFKKVVRRLFSWPLPAAWKGVGTTAADVDPDLGAMCEVWQKQTTDTVLLPSALLCVREINFNRILKPYFWFFFLLQRA